MKYLVFDECSKEDMDRLLVNLQVHNEARAKGSIPPHAFPDHIIHGDLPHFTHAIRTFKIYETDDPQQIINIEALYTANDLPTRKRWIIPITELTAFLPAYEQAKKNVKA